MLFKDKFYSFNVLFFDFVIIISYILVFISALGISNSAPGYLKDLNYIISVYICLFLIWRFNPISKLDKFTDLDRKIAFTAGMFILTTTILTNFMSHIKQQVNSTVRKFELMFFNH
jgi:hypothetical protein